MQLLTVSGSLRAKSSNASVLDALPLLVPERIRITRYAGLADLPHFNPDLEMTALPEVVAALRRDVGAADGLILSSPEYAHGIAGSFKNLLDWLVGSLDFPGKPVAVINAAPRAHHADAQLVTCRRSAGSAARDQVLVLFEKGQYTLAQTGTWDTLGMRGTCSPGAKFAGKGAAAQILPGSFADSSAQTMVPYSHILWSALWSGIAADAIARASAFVRGEARKRPGVIPSNAGRLARAHVDLQAMRHNWEACAIAFDEMTAQNDAAAREELGSMGWALRLNQLKIACSEMGPRIVHEALQIIGILGYKNDSKFSVGRHYRDLLSAALMISNERIAQKNASMLLVFKDD